MPANLVPHPEIPELADQVTPEMLRVLRRIQQADFIANSSNLDSMTSTILEQLTELGLVDPGYDEETNGQPTMWVANGNGSRVLVYKTGIRSGPHYELPSAELAAWLENQERNLWWTVDGDPLLTGRMTFPCPAKNLAGQLRKIDRPLLIRANNSDAANGERIGSDQIDSIVERIGNNVQVEPGAEMPLWSKDRILDLCWKGATDEWLLTEDSETTALMQVEHAEHSMDARGEQN